MCVHPELRLELPLEDVTREEGSDKADAAADDVLISNSRMESRGSWLLADDTSLERREPLGPTLQATTITQLASQLTG
jgi:hypothetical protein